MMEYTPVSSSTVSAVGYDETSNTLGVRFNNGSEYHYFGVPQDVFESSAFRLFRRPILGSEYQKTRLCLCARDLDEFRKGLRAR